MGEIDYIATVEDTSPAQDSICIDVDLPDGTYEFRCWAVDNNKLSEGSEPIQITIEDGNIAEYPQELLTNLTVQNTKDGVLLKWQYPHNSYQFMPTKFNVYADINPLNPSVSLDDYEIIDTVVYSKRPGAFFQYTTDNFNHDTTVSFVVYAVRTVAGIDYITTNDLSCSLTVDKVGPTITDSYNTVALI